MPLTQAASRERLHTRDIQICGYHRADGLYDIEARLSDTKSYGFVNQDRGYVEPGEKLHGMWLRLTLDETMTIVASEAATDDAPYRVCPSAAPAFSRLAGLRIKPGFLREASHRVGGAVGCTHLRELLQQIATTAYQICANCCNRSPRRHIRPLAHTAPGARRRPMAKRRSRAATSWMRGLPRRFWLAGARS